MAEGKRSGKPAHIRLPDELHVAVARYAEATSRPMTNAIVYLVGVGLRTETGTMSNPPLDIHTR